MKKIIMMFMAVMVMLATHAQQRNGGNDISERLENLTATEDQQVLEQKLNELKKSNTEDDLMLVYYYYNSEQLEEQAGATKTLILTKFPQGQLAFKEDLQKISMQKNLEEKNRLFMDLYNLNPDKNYGYLPYRLAQEFAGKGNEEKMRFYADIMSRSATDQNGEPLKKEFIYSQVASGLIRSDPDAAIKYLKSGLELSKFALDEVLADPNADQNMVARSKRNYFSTWNNYSQALLRGSNPEKGYEFIIKTYEGYKDNPNSDEAILALIRENYIDALIATKRFKEALPLMEDAIRNGAASEMVSTHLEEAYLATQGSANGFEDYRVGLLKEQKEKFIADVIKTAINKAAPDFELKDVDGKTVKLSDLRGKVVVLDFWATWCGPCKASFPTMQQAVNKYKNDPNVKFLFIHTWDKGGENVIEETEKYITDNNYTFEVLMDLRDPENKQSAVASAYELVGIPTKIIIDQEGQIRFKTAGFSADADKSIKKLSAMIDFSKK